MRRLLLILVIASALAAIAYALLGRGEPRPPRPLPEQDVAPEPPKAAEPDAIPAAATTATLVLRVRVPEGLSLPKGAEAGYRRFGNERRRALGADGTVRFTDVPVGLIDLVAEAEGFRGEPVPYSVQPNQPNEHVIVLEALPPPK